MRRFKLSAEIFKKIFLALGLLVIPVSFNACWVIRDKGAVVIDSSTSPLLNQGLKTGIELYQYYCSSCHGHISETTRANKSIAEIKKAITTVKKMNGLKILTDAEVEMISQALVKTGNGILVSNLNYQCDASNQYSRGSKNLEMRRLVKKELVNSLGYLLGAQTIQDSQIQVELNKIANDIMTTAPSDISYSHSGFYFSSLYSIAKRGGDLILNNSALKSQIFGSCSTTASASSADCVNNFLSNFAELALRRPLNEQEKNSYRALFNKINTSSNTDQAYRGLFIKALSGPHMAFHIEYGSQQIHNARRKLTPYEVASRLSYQLGSSTPDNALLSAAKNGQLSTVQDIKNQAQRILQTWPTAKSRTNELVSYYSKLEKIEKPNDKALLANGISLTGLVDEMKQEALDFSQYAIWNKTGSFETLMTNDDVFPRSARMSKILGAPITSGQTPTKTKYQRGLFLRPAVLASVYERTHIIRRGIHVSEQIYCTQNWGVPASAAEISSAQQLLPANDTLPNREYVGKMTGSSACIGCHAKFNPPGFLLENFDQTGMYRNQESLFDSSGQVAKTFPVEPAVENTGFEIGARQPASDAVEMASLLGKNANAAACFSQKLFQSYKYRMHDQKLDGCNLNEIYRATVTGSVLDAVVTAVASEDIYWMKQNYSATDDVVVNPTISTSSQSPAQPTTNGGVTNPAATCANCKNPYSVIAAGSHDQQNGFVLNGSALGYSSVGDYAVYNNLNFGTDGASALNMRVAAASYAGGVGYEIRLGSTTGEVIGNLTVTSTGDWGNFQVQSLRLTRKITGVQNIVIVSRGNDFSDFDQFQFVK